MPHEVFLSIKIHLTILLLRPCLSMPKKSYGMYNDESPFLLAGGLAKK